MSYSNPQMEFTQFLNNLTGASKTTPREWLEKELVNFVEGINSEVRDTLEEVLKEK